LTPPNFLKVVRPELFSPVRVACPPLLVAIMKVPTLSLPSTITFYCKSLCLTGASSKSTSMALSVCYSSPAAYDNFVLSPETSLSTDNQPWFQHPPRDRCSSSRQLCRHLQVSPLFFPVGVLVQFVDCDLFLEDEDCVAPPSAQSSHSCTWLMFRL